MRLDLGSGGHPRSGFDGVDVVDLGQRWVADLNVTPWPWPTSSVDEVWSSHLVEHVDDLVAFMGELWRVLAPGAIAEIRHPYAWSDAAVADPTHRRQLVELSWSYFDAEWRDRQGIGHYPIAADFAIKSADPTLSPDWRRIRDAAVIAGTWEGDGILRSTVNAIEELTVVLACRK